MSFFKHDTAIVSNGAQVGDDTRIWARCHIQEGAKIGSGCNICDGSFVEKGAVIGKDVTIKHNVCVFDGVTIEDNCFIGSNIAFINDRNPRSQNKDWVLEKTLVKKGVTLGCNVVVMCGLELGEYSFAAAGSVVVKNVNDYELVAGNPAKCIGFVCQCGKKLDESLSCKCGKSYEKSDKGLKIYE